MFGKQKYQPPPPGWTKRALTHWDCSDFGLYTIPALGWIVQGDVDVEWLSSTFKAAIVRRAPWLRGRLAKTQSGSPRYEIHVPPQPPSPGSDVEIIRLTVREVTEPIRSSVPYQPYGSTEPLAVCQVSTFDPEIISPHSQAPGGVDGCIERSDPLLRMHFTKGPDATIVSLAFPHCVFDGLGYAHLVEAWKEEMDGVPAKSDVDSMSEKPETFFDFTDEVDLDPTWSPTGWIPATLKMWAQAIQTFLKNKYFYRPAVYSTIIVPKWIIDNWKAVAKNELPKDKYVSTTDLVFAWFAKHATSPYPATDQMTLLSTICLRMRCPQFPAHLMTNSSTSYVLPDNFSVLDLQRLSVPEIALAFRRATIHYQNPNNVLREIAFEHRRIRDANGARTMMPLVNPNDKFLILDSILGMGLENVDFTKREKGIRGEEVKTLTKVVYFGEGMQFLSSDSMNGLRITGVIPKVCFESLKKALEKEAGALKAKL